MTPAFAKSFKKCHPNRVSRMGAPNFHPTFLAVELEPLQPQIEQPLEPYACRIRRIHTNQVG